MCECKDVHRCMLTVHETDCVSSCHFVCSVLCVSVCVCVCVRVSVCVCVCVCV